MKVVCLIPARSGSKGLKDKNMLFLDNKPMIFHTIDAAVDSGVFSKEDIYVSTDSDIYADICRNKGVSLLKRPKHLATDTASSFQVNQDFLKDFSDDQVFVLLQPTSPLRNGKQIAEAVQSYLGSGADHLVSYVKADKSPDLYTILSEDGYIQENFGVDQGYRRQDKKDYYVPNGAIFISRKDKYLSDQSYFTDKTKAYIMDKQTSLDIDDEVDFQRAIASHYFNYPRREAVSKAVFANQYKQMASNLENKLIVGDSRLTAFYQEGYSNLSIPGATMHTFMENKDLLLSDKISHLVLAIGVNDFIIQYDVVSLQKQFRDLVNICQDREIILSIASIALTLYRGVDNQAIVDFNRWLKELATRYHLNFIDVNDLLSQNNNLRFELTSDGLLFSNKGEQIYVEQIKTLIAIGD